MEQRGDTIKERFIKCNKNINAYLHKGFNTLIPEQIRGEENILFILSQQLHCAYSANNPAL
jgi:hypothetical protein